jgi:hypothetical protein
VRLRQRWKDIIKMGLQETGCEGVDWIQLAHDSIQRHALVDMVINLKIS